MRSGSAGATSYYLRVKPIVKRQACGLAKAGPAIECPPTINILAENIFAAADHLLTPLMPTTLSLCAYEFPVMATWHLPTALETAVALRNLNPTRLAVGHGRVLENPAHQMEQAIREAEAKANAQTQTA